jgi:hypothetical protein
MSRTPVAPVTKDKSKGKVVAESEGVGQLKDRVIPLIEQIDPAELVTAAADALEVGGKAEMLKFMEDVLTVTVMTSADEKAQAYVPIWVNGRPFYFIRGMQHKAKRKFVEGLARAKHTGIRIEISKDVLGEPTNKAISTTGIKYPFSVQHDPAGAKGAAWLEQVLSEA